ncbi:hypothetical protein GE21DRAFT_9890 [Neurospora crassa]|uniref:Uncharacterized protein n=1 Tax=Neurospora crassa (strain ATCC 24698 / 74-OR23-1A / CBS 708.71 / DSM 1257 / FGSC 987) TaxID=367110 RepID=Q7S4M3_NEUCR|nr:hypothetical protein NCU09577 [Neurospora crassa OR74A]EAA30452.2 hypothetical protein NCU09577 [Neurospora crassa OR74A]KHE81545.1 hypothetical protein GE21DRAFT_9890 [Neurospora crassa]|eukprot:XP_959688.2 hypothetical protein NCU09577 [Neurospora crassa OR74A]
MNGHLGNGEECFNIDMPNMNVTFDQASRQVQNQPTQLQFRVMGTAHNNNVPAVEFGPIAHGPVQIPPDTVARRARLKNALLNFDTNREVAWQKMPGHVRYGFHKELAKAETCAEPLEAWEKYLLSNNSEEDKIRVYRELACERYRERERLLVKLNDHLEKHDGLRNDMQMLKEHVVNLEYTVQQNEFARQQMTRRIADLERSHLELASGLDERVYLLNEKVDRKVQNLEGAVEELKKGEEELSDMKEKHTRS